MIILLLVVVDLQKAATFGKMLLETNEQLQLKLQHLQDEFQHLQKETEETSSENKVFMRLIFYFCYIP